MTTIEIGLTPTERKRAREALSGLGALPVDRKQEELWTAAYVLGLRAGAKVAANGPIGGGAVIRFYNHQERSAAIRWDECENGQRPWGTPRKMADRRWHSWVELLEAMDGGEWWHMIQGERGDV